ncbi:MAG TPA: DUF1456 family protein [Rectinemataceae bacterium]|nr:DUF1456 family protein [Rectinemataceae bacterium]
MTNNDVLRRLRYALNLPDPKLIELFALAGRSISSQELGALLMREDEAGYAECDDATMGQFLDGLVSSRRGKREAGPEGGPGLPGPPRARLSNNDILKRLRIALELVDEDIIAIMLLAGVKLSKSELSALFRKPGHPNFRPCGDQFLRNFLSGLTSKYRV